MGGGRRTVTYVEQLLVYEALLLQILEESITSSIIADKISLKLYDLWNDFSIIVALEREFAVRTK
jgi:hypothetical protein